MLDLSICPIACDLYLSLKKVSWTLFFTEWRATYTASMPVVIILKVYEGRQIASLYRSCLIVPVQLHHPKKKVSQAGKVASLAPHPCLDPSIDTYVPTSEWERVKPYGPHVLLDYFHPDGKSCLGYLRQIKPRWNGFTEWLMLFFPLFVTHALWRL